MAVDFNDGKDADALRTIGEVCKAMGIKAHVLRYWEQQFPTLKPLKRSGGRRYYRPEDVAMVERIDQLVNAQGYTLKGARAALKQAGSTDSGNIGAVGASRSAPAAPAEPAHLIIGAANQDELAEPVEVQQPDNAAEQLVPQLKAIRKRLTDALAA